VDGSFVGRLIRDFGWGYAVGFSFVSIESRVLHSSGKIR
jgi:hypothetical protein